jgi:ribosomal protein S18 acetylase RimI-like enzyme
VDEIIPMQEEIEIIPFRKELAPFFRELNMAWLEKYFYVEPIDVEVLGDPEGVIINKGGYIYFAKWRDAIVGTFALIAEGDGIYELGKMAVNEEYQGKKIGNQLLQYCLEQASELGATKVILYSNTKLVPAIHLYRKYGFTEVPLGASDYKRSNIKMEKIIKTT